MSLYEAIKEVIEAGLIVTSKNEGYIRHHKDRNEYIHQTPWRSTDSYDNVDECIAAFLSMENN